MKRRRELICIGAALLLGLAAAAATQLPIQDYARLLQHWIEQCGPWGIVLFVPCYVLAAMFAPSTPLTILAGFAFGLSVGLPVVMVAIAVSATVTFLLSRYFLREWVSAALSGKAEFQALDRALVDNGWRLVILSQLSPFIPFNLQNLFYGLSGIALRIFVPASVVGVFPGVTFYVYLGAVGKAATQHSMSLMQWILLLVGPVATALFLLLIGRNARKRLSEITGKQG